MNSNMPRQEATDTDSVLVAEIRQILSKKPTYGYRRVTVVLNARKRLEKRGAVRFTGS